MKRYAFLLVMLSATACTTMGKLREQQGATAAEKSRADGLAKELAAAKTADAAAIEAGQKIQLDLTNQFAASQKTNKDLAQALDAKKGELTQKVAELIKERDSVSAQNAALTGQIADLQKKAADLEAARAAAEAEKAVEVDKVKKSYEDLTAGLKSEIAAGEIKITQLKGKLTVNLVDRILFDSGKAEVKDDGRKVLDKVGGILNTVQDKNIRIEGHTDNKPITGELQSKYASNWELSTARATAVARYLQDKAKVDPTRLVAAGFGEYHPVAPNDTQESRALNRRIEIVLVPRD